MPGRCFRHAVILAFAMVALTFHSETRGQSHASATNIEPVFPADQIEYFEKHIRPLLNEHCLECHGQSAEDVRGGLWLTSRAAMLAGGDSGPAIIPGNSDASLLIEAVHYDSFEMPPQGQLPADMIRRLETWIQNGAADPRRPDDLREQSAAPNIEEGRQFWSFQPIPKAANWNSQLTAPVDSSYLKPDQRPAGTDEGLLWNGTEIDRLVARTWRQHGLEPAPDADRDTVLRRLHFVLTGIPPTIDQLHDFRNSNAAVDEDVARVVDELIESPEFGQRWGRHWLDVARFAESSGGGRSLMFPHAWRYRDYVIDSFNHDKPFKRMILEQIAGDLLPFENQHQRNEQLVATGFLALGPHNYEQQDKEQLRLDVIDEQIDTVGRAFLGLTIGCARCHDHKFDPIPIRDYYALAGIFSSTISLVDGNVSGYVTRPLATEQQRLSEENYRKRVDELSKKLKLAQAALADLVPNSGLSPKQRIVDSKDLRGIVIDDRSAEKSGFWKHSVSVKSYVDQGYVHDAHQPGPLTIQYQTDLESGGKYEVRLSYSPGSNRASNTKVTIDHQDGETVRVINQTQTPPIDDLFISLGVFRFEANNLATVTISNENADGVVIADAVQWLKIADHGQGESAQDKRSDQFQQSDSNLSPRGQKTDSKDGQAPNQSATIDEAKQQAMARVHELEIQLRELKKSAPRPLDLAMSVQDSAHPTDGHLHIRGSVRNLGPIVPRGFLSVLDHPETPPIPITQSGRLELATWIASDQNPLTARVYVNRVWKHIFGVGLVATPDNFGKMGRPPSHPELLDFLARRFIEQGWSTKQLIREILQSRLFRLSSATIPAAEKSDPENRYLWRANRRRVDVEFLRDSMLAISGELDREAGGRTIRKITQYDLGYEFDTNRRSIYVPAFRNSMLEIFETFDQANPNLVVGHRATSTLPTQALFLMNNNWVRDRAKATARRLIEQSVDPQQRFRLAFETLLSRPASDLELEQSQQFLLNWNASGQGGQDRSAVTMDEAPTDQTDRLDNPEAWTDLVHAILASVDFRYIY